MTDSSPLRWKSDEAEPPTLDSEHPTRRTVSAGTSDAVKTHERADSASAPSKSVPTTAVSRSITNLPTSTPAGTFPTGTFCLWSKHRGQRSADGALMNRTNAATHSFTSPSANGDTCHVLMSPSKPIVRWR